MGKSNRLLWADIIKGICMMAILLFHTEVYYAGQEIIPYHCYVTNALLAFFFISGFFFSHSDKVFSPRRKFFYILRALILPYFIFTILLAVPKTIVHGDGMSPLEVACNILSGKASWFVASLATAELLFSVILKYAKNDERKIFVFSALPYLLVAAGYHFLPTTILQHCNIWCWQNALLALPFIFFGHYCRRHPTVMEKMYRLSTVLCSLLIVILLKYIECAHDIYLTLEPITVGSFFILLIDGILSIVVLVGICKRLPNIKFISWTGRHSLVYYFFCGAAPTMVTMSLQRMGFSYTHYWQIPLAFVLVYLIATLIAWLIYRFAPWMVGRKNEKLKMKN